MILIETPKADPSSGSSFAAAVARALAYSVGPAAQDTQPPHWPIDGDTRSWRAYLPRAVSRPAEYAHEATRDTAWDARVFAWAIRRAALDSATMTALHAAFTARGSGRSPGILVGALKQWLSGSQNLPGDRRAAALVAADVAREDLYFAGGDPGRERARDSVWALGAQFPYTEIHRNNHIRRLGLILRLQT
jgi:hypothetical protein